MESRDWLEIRHRATQGMTKYGMNELFFVMHDKEGVEKE